MIKTLSALRVSFWENHPQFASDFRVKKRQNDYKCDIRCSWVDYVDSLSQDGIISEKLRNNATL